MKSIAALAQGIIAVVLLCASDSALARSDTYRTLTWKDLAPPVHGEEVFDKLTKSQLERLGDVAFFRDLRARGEKLAPVERKEEREIVQKLRAEGVDVEGLVRKRREVMARREARTRSANPLVVNQAVRMPGYLLPLEFKGQAVTHFLLVPWVGACIHTPPPPPNQIVFVSVERPYPVDSPYTPVWVKGRLVSSAGKHMLSFVDGQASIEVVYSLTSAQVEPYDTDRQGN